MARGKFQGRKEIFQGRKKERISRKAGRKEGRKEERKEAKAKERTDWLEGPEEEGRKEGRI